MAATKFPEMPWYEASERVARATYRVYTDHAMGTAFLLMVGLGGPQHMAILETAWHVVSNAEKGTSLRLCDQHGNEVVRSKDGNIAAMEIGADIDCGLIVVTSDSEIFSQDLLLPILPWDVHLRRGTDIGWLGYPGITEPDICFFHGHIAGMRKQPPVYLVDGVAINGVSGGPVFDNRCHLAGLVSAYQPNKVDDNTVLPGVSWMVPINYIYAWVTKWLKPRDLYAGKDT